jgi:methyl-accepting chemotaxis protein
MMTWIDNRSVGEKLVAKFIITLLGLTLMATVGLVGLKAQLWADREKQVRIAVGVAEGVAHAIDAQVCAGELTRQAGRERLLGILQAARYDTDKYFAVVLDDGTIIVHGGNPVSVGTNDYDKQDIPGHFYMRISLAAAHSHPEGAFFRVYANLPGGPRMKVNFIKAMPE